jgi:hypothetical protein
MGIKKVWILVCALLLLSNFYVFADESLTITTYYPSPYGVYRALKLFPTTPAPYPCDSTNEGTLYYDSAFNTTRQCVRDSATTYNWVNVGTGGGGGGGLTCTIRTAFPCTSGGALCTINCNSDEYVTGGGCNGIVVNQTRPIIAGPGGQWGVICTSIGGVDYTGYAMCCK